MTLFEFVVSRFALGTASNTGHIGSGMQMSGWSFLGCLLISQSGITVFDLRKIVGEKNSLIGGV